MITKIYTLSSTRDCNNVRYIGKTIQPLKYRLNKHLFDAVELRLKRHVYNWVRKELNDGFQIIISQIDETDRQDWQIIEQYWISQFKSWGFKLTNITIGGAGYDGAPRSEETRRKISKSKKGVPNTKEHNENTRKGIIALQGKPVRQYDMNGNFIKEYPCGADAANATGANKKDISACCNGKLRRAKGYYWKFSDDKTPLPIYYHRSVFQLKGNEIIAVYDTVKQASEATGIACYNINRHYGRPCKSTKWFTFLKYNEFMKI